MSTHQARAITQPLVRGSAQRLVADVVVREPRVGQGDRGVMAAIAPLAITPAAVPHMLVSMRVEREVIAKVVAIASEGGTEVAEEGEAKAEEGVTEPKSEWIPESSEAQTSESSEAQASESSVA